MDINEPFVSYSDNEFLNKQKDLGVLPMKYKFLLADLTLFHSIINNKVEIKLPNYIVRMEPHDVKSVTRNSCIIAKSKDMLKYKINVTQKN